MGLVGTRIHIFSIPSAYVKKEPPFVSKPPLISPHLTDSTHPTNDSIEYIIFSEENEKTNGPVPR